MKSIKAGFTGPFADANLGDYGMLLNNILDLSQNLSSIKVFTYDEDFLTNLFSEYLPNLTHSFCTVELDKQLELDAKEGFRLTPIEILQGISNYSEVEDSVSDLDVLVVNGGGYFNELWCQPHRVSKMLQILAPLLIADDLGLPIVFTGNSYGPFGPRSDFLQRILASLRNATFYSRDRVGSTAELRKIGIAEKNIHFVPDDLFILNEGLSQSEPNLNLPEAYVVVETYQPLEALQSGVDEIALFDASMREQGLEVVLLPMYSGRGGEDQAKWLADEFGWINVKLRSGYLRVNEAHQVISGAELVICDRYHALVLALANETPVIHALRTVMEDKWYYFRKSLGILDTALRGIPFRQADFMAISPFQAMERANSGLKEIQHIQRALFGSGLQENITLADTARRQMLTQIIHSGDHAA